MNNETLRKMSDQELSKRLHYCATGKSCSDCILGVEIVTNWRHYECINLLMEEASTRLLKWGHSVNNEFFKEKCE